MNNSKCVNTRILQHQLTGVQRFLTNVLYYLPKLDQISPNKYISGVQAHIWEQTILPLSVKSRVLWSPVGSGPLAIRKQVITIHDLAPLDNPTWQTSKFVAWHNYMLPKLTKRCSHIIAISNFTKSRILKNLNVDPNKISVVYNGVDSMFSPQESTFKEKVVKKLNLPSPNYVLALGSLEPRKNLTRLINVWTDILSKLPDSLWLIIAGDSGSKNVFKQVNFSGNLARVHFTGKIEDKYLPALYAGAKFFIYPSLYEGFGLPILESMACGCPVISSNTGALPEISGGASLEIDPKNEKQIAQGIKTMLNHKSLRNKLTIAGQKRVSQFSWKKTAEQTLEVLESVEIKPTS